MCHLPANGAFVLTNISGERASRALIIVHLVAVSVFQPDTFKCERLTAQLQ